MAEGTDAIALSAVVCVHDEEERLEGCLECLRFADEIVVVLDKCADGSKEIAARVTDRLVEGSWEREGPRRHAGIDAARGRWILEVDADERVGPELAAEIRRTVEASGDDVHNIPVHNYVGGRLVLHGWGGLFGKNGYPGLFRKGAKTWGDERVHPGLTRDGTQGRDLVNPLRHDVDRDISDMIRRFDRYTTLRAADLRERGIPPVSFANLVRKIFSRFWKSYVARKGYREDGHGFLIALFAALYPIVSHLKATLEDE